MLLSYGQTDIGQKRSTNQDAILLLPEQQFFMVADGMGGHNGGDIASQLCAKLMQDHFVTHHGKKAPKDLLHEGVIRVNQGIYAHAEKNPELKGMGTTLNALHFANGLLYMANIGDSRTYLIQNSKLYQLTRDHSLVNEKLTNGLYTRDQAKEDPQKNILTKTVGFEPDVLPDVYQYKVVKNDLFISCSDGLYGRVSDEDIVTCVNQELPLVPRAEIQDITRLVKRLITLANSNGGNDNISVVAVLAK